MASKREESEQGQGKVVKECELTIEAKTSFQYLSRRMFSSVRI